MIENSANFMMFFAFHVEFFATKSAAEIKEEKEVKSERKREERKV